MSFRLGIVPNLEWVCFACFVVSTFAAASSSLPVNSKRLRLCVDSGAFSRVAGASPTGILNLEAISTRVGGWDLTSLFLMLSAHSGKDVDIPFLSRGTQSWLTVRCVTWAPPHQWHAKSGQEHVETVPPPHVPRRVMKPTYNATMCCYVRISYNETEDMRLYLRRFQRGLRASE